MFWMHVTRRQTMLHWIRLINRKPENKQKEKIKPAVDSCVMGLEFRGMCTYVFWSESFPKRRIIKIRTHNFLQRENAGWLCWTN